MHRHIGKRTVLSVATLLALAAGAAQAQQNDPLYRYQWHLMNYGQSVLGDTKPVSSVDLGIDDLHDYNIRGKGVVIGVLDDGLEIDHPDLAANVVPNGSKNFFVTATRGEHDTGPNSFGQDGHGTAVSGIIGAVGWNGIGVRGVAPAAKLRGFNFLVTTFFLDLGPFGSFSRNDQATDANIRYAWWDGAESKDVQVSNNSWGGMGPWPDAFSENQIAAFERPMSATRNGLGMIYVKAAGNDFNSVNKDQGAVKCNADTKLRNVGCMQAFLDPRNNLFNVMTIAAVNAAGRRASYSTPGAALWVSGLGGESGVQRQVLLDQGIAPERIDQVLGPEAFDPAIVTTDLAGCAIGLNTNGLGLNRLDSSRSAIDASCNYTGAMNGTSAATPTVSGVVALMLQANPKLTYRDVKYILATTARRIHPDQPAATAADGTVLVPGWTRNAAGYFFSNWYGYGLVDATAAVTRANNFKSLAALVDSGWQRSAAQPAAIGNAAAPARLSIPVAGIRRVESVQIGLTTDYAVAAPPVNQTSSPLPLSVALVSPQGTRSVVVPASMAVASGGAAFTLDLAASNAFLDEDATGNWTLEVADIPLAAGAASAGNLTSFKLRVLGR
ncbi:S8 family serine peptidase [Lysobacter enzymogenes]|uniref:S8 family serine peptidase n=1 Tax=Lysobacter enzymogenes TaxID=69 RepID=UPI000899430E|nr:S8 family serine peptidase [Lysobacter enzymogenes]SDX97736.1 Serine protease, subtilisin family [Lysobacter enzymogenes]